MTATFDHASAATFHAPRPLGDATLLLLRHGPEAQAVTLNGRAVEGASRNLHGFDFDAITLDLAHQARVRVG